MPVFESPAPPKSPLGAPDLLRIKQLEEQASALRNSVICAFNQLLDLKDLNTGVHSTRLAEWGMRVGQELGLEEA
jgi:HD-GYP domain-containing protein (c-di-GMP phosphodiesterase class II)